MANRETEAIKAIREYEEKPRIMKETGGDRLRGKRRVVGKKAGWSDGKRRKRRRAERASYKAGGQREQDTSYLQNAMPSLPGRREVGWNGLEKWRIA